MMQRQLQLPFLVTYIGVEQWALEALVDTLLLLHPGNLGRITASATLDDRQCSASKLLRDTAAYAADGCV